MCSSLTHRPLLPRWSLSFSWGSAAHGSASALLSGVSEGDPLSTENHQQLQHILNQLCRLFRPPLSNVRSVSKLKVCVQLKPQPPPPPPRSHFLIMILNLDITQMFALILKQTVTCTNSMRKLFSNLTEFFIFVILESRIVFFLLLVFNTRLGTLGYS